MKEENNEMKDVQRLYTTYHYYNICNAGNGAYG
jgi:hypothetical protein